MTWHNLKDRSSTNLAAAYTQGDSTLEVADANLLPTVPYYLSAYDSATGNFLLEWEVTSATGNVLTVSVSAGGDADIPVGTSVGILVNSKNLEEVREGLDDLTTTVTTHTSSLSSLSSTVSGHTSSLSSLSTTVGGHTSSLSSLSTTVGGHTTSIGTIQSDVAALSTTVSGHTSSLSSLSTTVGGHTSSLSTLDSTVSSLGTTVGGHTTSIGTIQSDVSALSTTVSGHTTAITNLQGTDSFLQMDIDALYLQVAGKANTSHTHAASAITSGTVDTARLGTGTASSSTYLRGDQTWQTIAAGGMAIGGAVSGSTANKLCYIDGSGNLANSTGTYFYGTQMDFHPSADVTPIKFFAAEGQSANLLSAYNHLGWPLFWIDANGGLSVYDLKYTGTMYQSVYSVNSLFCNANSRFNFITPTSGGDCTALLPYGVTGMTITVKNVGGSGTVTAYDHSTWGAVGPTLTSGQYVTAVYDGGSWQVVT